MAKQHIVLAGSSGLVGAEVLRQLAQSSSTYRITCLVRSLPAVCIPQVEYLCVDFEHLSQVEIDNFDSLICCLGTTIKKAGSPEAFRKVDFQYVENLIELAERMSANSFHVVSAMGADKNALVLYNRVKGEMQESLQKSSISVRIVYQPSLLLGNRNEFRLAERIASVVMRFFSPLMVGKLQAYKAIEASAVAHSICSNLDLQKPGFYVVSNAEMLQD